MPMPLMGATAPASQIATVVLSNCEVLATLCLVQAAEPGVPFIYAPISALMDPRSGMLKSGAIERAAMSATTTEIFRMCKQAHRGIVCHEGKWLDDEIDRIGPGGHFLEQNSTAQAVRGDEWYIGQLGIDTSFEEWEAAGKPDLVEEARDMVDQILSSHEPLALDAEINRELDCIRKSAADNLHKK